MLKGWQAGFATIVVTLVTSALIAFDLGDGAVRRWWSARAFTTDAVGGILVVLITVLIVNQLLGMRQQRERSRATAAQAVMLLGQAIRATRAVVACGAADDRSTAYDEVRTYMTMLMIAAPILIDAKAPRAFLELAQNLAAQLVQTVNPATKSYLTGLPPGEPEHMLQQLKIAAAPLLVPLTTDERTAAGGTEV